MKQRGVKLRKATHSIRNCEDAVDGLGELRNCDIKQR
jgi:hypothetical protein